MLELDHHAFGELAKLLEQLDATRRVEVRPMRDGTGRSLQVSKRSRGIEVDLLANTYFRPRRALSAVQRHVLAAGDWDVRAATRVQPGSVEASKRFSSEVTRRSIADELMGLAAQLFDEAEIDYDVISARRNYRLFPAPPEPHAIVRWKPSRDTPFDELNHAIDRVLTSGARRVCLTDYDDGSSDYIAFVAGRRLPLETCRQLSSWCLAEMPIDAGRDAFWLC